MLDGQKSINEDGIAFSIKKRDRIGNPRKIFLSGRKSLGRATTFLGQKLPSETRYNAAIRKGLGVVLIALGAVGLLISGIVAPRRLRQRFLPCPNNAIEANNLPSCLLAIHK